MDVQPEPKPFNPWWAAILVLLVFNFLPIPFYLILESIGGDWLMQNTTRDFIFNVEPEQMWQQATGSLGIDMGPSMGIGGQA